MSRKHWVAAATVAAAGWAAPPASAELVYGVTDSNNIAMFDSATPGTIIDAIPVNGIDGTIGGIDVRPATLQIYVLTKTGQLYRVNSVTGAATALGAPLPLTGTDFDIDFNPTVDRLRVVSNGEQNLRVNPNNGALVQADSDLTPAGNVTGAAYTANAPLAGGATTLLDIDTGSDQLLTQNPPNSGTLVDGKPLGVDLVGDVGFDISTASAAGAPGGDTAYVVGRTADTNDRLYTVNTATGAATPVGEIGGLEKVNDIAVAAAVPRLAVVYTPSVGAQSLVTVRADVPGTANTPVTISGLQGGEQIVGLDRRPSGGTVYAVGSTSRIYTLDLATGAATPVAPTPFTPALAGGEFGLDFNPVADRLRLISDSEQNLRLNPLDGTTTADDPAVAYADADTNAGQNPNVTAAAYTNPVSPAPAATTLFDLDTTADILVTQDLATQRLSTVGPLGLNAGDGNGYDIVARFNQQFAALDPVGVGAVPALYSVNSFTPAANPNDQRTALVGTLGGLPDPLAQVAAMTVITDNVLPGGTATPDPTPTATPTVTPTATATPQPKVAPKLGAKVKPKADATKPFRFTVSGRVKPPATVDKARACKGKVRLTATRKGTKLAGVKAPVNSACRFKGKLELRKKAGEQGKAKIKIRFGGNGVLLTKEISRRVTYGS